MFYMLQNVCVTSFVDPLNKRPVCRLLNGSLRLHKTRYANHLRIRLLFTGRQYIKEKNIERDPYLFFTVF